MAKGKGSGKPPSRRKNIKICQDQELKSGIYEFDNRKSLDEPHVFIAPHGDINGCKADQGIGGTDPEKGDQERGTG